MVLEILSLINFEYSLFSGRQKNFVRKQFSAVGNVPFSVGDDADNVRTFEIRKWKHRRSADENL